MHKILEDRKAAELYKEERRDQEKDSKRQIYKETSIGSLSKTMETKIKIKIKVRRAMAIKWSLCMNFK